MEEKLLYKQALSEPVPLPARPGEDALAVHHDWGAYQRQGYPRETLSSAIMIDECRADNGPMRVFPGSHHKNYPLELNYTPLSAENLPAALGALGVSSLDDAVAIIGPPGTVVIFHSMLVHYSGPNPTHAPRRIMIYSHYPSWHETEPDKRNRPLRERAQAHERQYRELVAAGAYQDRWRAPGR
jgi:ectoine hydroxylase-related dioxygenase (phytanoyl-CoA dioxygenase family)